MSGFLLDTELLLTKYSSVMLLKIFVNDDNEALKEKYCASAINRSLALRQTPEYCDAGFDVFTSTDVVFEPLKGSKIDFGITCSAVLVSNTHFHNTGFYMYPRSSLANSGLRLANSVGIIDSAYRGHLIGAFDNLSQDVSGYTVNRYDRLVQICAPGLVPIIVTVVNTLEELGEKTQRGTGGFGSTGI
jgi:dUTP pyrophosphatase